MSSSGTVTGTGTDPTAAPHFTPTHTPTLNPNYYDNSYLKVSCSRPNTQALSVPSALPTRFPTFGMPSIKPTAVGYTAAPTVENIISFDVAQV